MRDKCIDGFELLVKAIYAVAFTRFDDQVVRNLGRVDDRRDVYRYDVDVLVGFALVGSRFHSLRDRLSGI